MRRLLLLLAVVFAACGDIGDAINVAPEIAQHVPSISSIQFSPDSVPYMEGDGSVVVTAEIAFRDVGLDIQALWVRVPDGTSIKFDETFATETGTFTEDFAMPTTEFGVFSVEFWLVDQAGNTSSHGAADFDVGWTKRLGALPYPLNDVVWNGDIFVAVGDDGAILTSTDGIGWIARESGSNATLYAVAAIGTDIFALGDGIMLLSTNHGENWVTKDTPDSVNLSAVAGNTSLIVAGGSVMGPDMLPQLSIMISEDRGDSWQAVELAAGSSYLFRDLIYRNGHFVAATEMVGFGPVGDARVQVSSDGKLWHEVVVLPEGRGLREIIHDGSQFIATGVFGAVFTSFDGFNWTGIRTPPGWPDRDVEYLSTASDGSTLLVAGGIWESCALMLCNPESESPIGASSTDGGASWKSFNIDGRYKSHGMAFGNGRFVSVGQSAPGAGDGAIYTAD